MKRFKHTAILLFVIIVFNGCDGGGGSGSDNGSRPQITDVVIFNVENGVETQTRVFSIGDRISFNAYASDADMDMSQLVIEEYYPLDATTPYFPPTELALPTVPQADVYFYPLEPGTISGPAGDWKVDFYIIDKKGNESNTWTVYLTIN